MSGTDGGGARAGQEAARLLAAAQDWLRTSAPHLAPVDADGEPCSCPLCRAVAGLREADPDAVAGWVDAAVAGVSTAVSQTASAAADLARAAGATTHERSDDADEDGSPEQPGSAGDGVPDETSRPPAAEPEGGQDGPAPRRVRRVPLDDEGGTGVGPDLP